MLTLTRKIGQKILIGNGIEIVVREIRGKQVRLGITAPDGLPVFREELFQQIATENTKASQGVALEDLEAIESSSPPPDSATSKSNGDP